MSARAKEFFSVTVGCNAEVFEDVLMFTLFFAIYLFISSHFGTLKLRFWRSLVHEVGPV